VYPAGYEQTLQAALAGLTPAAFDAARARAGGMEPPQIIAMGLNGLACTPLTPDPPRNTAAE
jgi:hypothetical protein